MDWIKLIGVLSPLVVGVIADSLLGDPGRLHPIIGFGKIIAWGEKKLNKGRYRMLKGGLFSVLLILLSFYLIYLLLEILGELYWVLPLVLSTVVVFYCLAAKTLIDEVRQVFVATDRSIEEGRLQVARIVGRDTSDLSPQEIRTAALETLSENLSDGVIAPLFWYMLLGAPGMFAYKMVNTQDSMIGYKNERYGQFGCWAAYLDDLVNYIPARLTAFLMLVVAGKFRLFGFVKKYGPLHASPNSGYPEAALAGILDCRFGGPNFYFGKKVDKPYIGDNPKRLTTSDMEQAIRVNKRTEIAMLAVVFGGLWFALEIMA